MNRRDMLLAPLSPLAAALLGACGPRDEGDWAPGMARIVWDRDTCARCGMAIGDRRFAAQLRGGPQDEVVKFDDIGCATSWCVEKVAGRPWINDPATAVGRGVRRQGPALAAGARGALRGRAQLPDGLQPGRPCAAAGWQPALRGHGRADGSRLAGPLPPRRESHMKSLWLTARLDLAESLRSRWFAIYTAVFGGIVALLFLFGLTESRVLGFIGLSRLLVTYIQLTMAIMPIFVLITTVRSVAGDREAGVFEYLLSLPVSLGAWFWGKILGRYLVIFLPVAGAMALAVVIALVKGIEVPWSIFGYYTALLAVMCACFLGLGMLISALARSTDMAQGAAFMLWLLLLLFLDLILLGVMIQGKLRPEMAVTLALANPLQVFRTAALALFDPQLIVLGPSAFVILDLFGVAGYKVFALAYPALLGLAAAGLGYAVFRRGDLP
jgi:ABC-2 type transport system permease protein